MRFRLAVVVGTAVALLVVFAAGLQPVFAEHGSKRGSDETTTDEVADRLRAAQEGTLDYVVPKEVLTQDLINEMEARKATEIALSDDRLRQHLSNSRYALAQVALDERGFYDEKSAGCEGPRVCSIVTLVNYTRGETINVRVHLERQEVMEITVSPGVLTFDGDDEGHRAYEIAVNHPRIAAELRGRSYWLWGDPDPGERRGTSCAPGRQHRCVVVLIKTPPDLLDVLVDLTTERVEYWAWEYGWFDEYAEP